MNCWTLLDITPTSDKAAIKKAFAIKVKENPPDADPEAYQKLREAYSEALKFSVQLQDRKLILYDEDEEETPKEEIHPEATRQSQESSESESSAEKAEAAQFSEKAESPEPEKVQEAEVHSESAAVQESSESESSAEKTEAAQFSEKTEEPEPEKSRDVFESEPPELSYQFAKIAEIRNSMSYNKAFTLSDVVDYFLCHGIQESSEEKRLNEKAEKSDQRRKTICATLAGVLVVMAIIVAILEKF